MNIPVFYVDFNEMLEENLFLLSVGDEKRNNLGEDICIYEGMMVQVYMDDVNDNGEIDNLIALGVVEKNKKITGWGKHVKWCCRIDGNGVRHQSEI